jgi:hypothetical protein
VAAVTFVPEVISEISAVIGGNEYAEAVASVKFTPAQSTQVWKGGTPAAVFTGMTNPTYSCAMKIGQDWNKTSSLVNYLMAHAGEHVAATFKFNSGATITATLILAAPEIGGDVDGWAETTLTHGVDGVPLVTPAPAG